MRQQLAVSVIERHYLRVIRWSPAHLHANGPNGGGSARPDWGQLCFVGRAVRGSEVATARYLRIQQRVAPSRLARLIAKYWKLRRPVVCVIGGPPTAAAATLTAASGSASMHASASPPSPMAAAASLPQRWSPRLQRVVARGLAAAVKSTNALVMGGGDGSGLGELVGAAVAEGGGEEGRSSFPAVGFISWQAVRNRHRLADNAGGAEPRHYPIAQGAPAAAEGGAAQLGAHHTHLVMVDAGGEGGEGVPLVSVEERVRDETLEAYSRIYDAPCALLVLGGGVGTLHSIWHALEHCRGGVLLLADTGGAAGALSVYLEQHQAAIAAAAGSMGGRSGQGGHGGVGGSLRAIDGPLEALAAFEGGAWLEHAELLERLCQADAASGAGLLRMYRLGAASVGSAATEASEATNPLDLAILRTLLCRHEHAAAEATAVRAASGGSVRGPFAAPARHRRGPLHAPLHAPPRWLLRAAIEKPVRLVVQWDRADVMRELIGRMHAREDATADALADAPPALSSISSGIDYDEGAERSAIVAPFHRGSNETVVRGDPASLDGTEMGARPAAQAVHEAVQCALQCALELQRVEIVALLLSHRASLSQVPTPLAKDHPHDNHSQLTSPHPPSHPQVNLVALYTCALVSEATASAFATSESLTALRARPMNVRRRPPEEAARLDCPLDCPDRPWMAPWMTPWIAPLLSSRSPLNRHSTAGTEPLGRGAARPLRGGRGALPRLLAAVVRRRLRGAWQADPLVGRLLVERRRGRVGAREHAVAAHDQPGAPWAACALSCLHLGLHAFVGHRL